MKLLSFIILMVTLVVTSFAATVHITNNDTTGKIVALQYPSDAAGYVYTQYTVPAGTTLQLLMPAKPILMQQWEASYVAFDNQRTLDAQPTGMNDLLVDIVDNDIGDTSIQWANLSNTSADWSGHLLAGMITMLGIGGIALGKYFSS